MTEPSEVFRAELAALDEGRLRRRRRVVEPADGAALCADGRRLLAFAGNDYLGLARHPELIAAAQEGAARWGVGATASPLVCGHGAAHQALEEELARFVGLPRALYFYAGYAANTGIVPALVGRGDVVISDALNHACLIDGARLSRAEVAVHPHLDLVGLEAALAGARGARRRLVLTDAVFSMDGDLAPLPALLALCERHDAWLLVDDAHGFGVLGEGGRGCLSHWGLRAGAMPPRLIYMATLGKAAGVSGAFVAGPEPVVEWLMQKARTYMFATGAPAMVAQALRAALVVIEREGWRRERLRALRERLAAGLAGLPWAAPRSDSAIQPVIVGDNGAALAVQAALEERGLWVPAIRPPTVPQGTARLRISLSAAHAADDVDRLVQALREAAQAPAGNRSRPDR
jgi:8-amino-7-oxononanoate synthase